MRKNPRNIIAAAAITGLLAGAAINQSVARDAGTNSTSTNSVTAGKAAQKAPTVHTCSGQNDCKGLGGCKTGDNGCKFKNSCKGKGGCDITAKDIKAWKKAHKDA